VSNPYEPPRASQSEQAPPRVDVQRHREALRAVFAFALMTIALAIIAVAVFAFGISFQRGG
jgi:hypothetical protein